MYGHVALLPLGGGAADFFWSGERLPVVRHGPVMDHGPVDP